jgi:hypothetical protein
MKNANTATYLRTWTGAAWNNEGKRIDRAGNVLPNPNASGSGGGSAQALGTNNNTYGSVGQGACMTSTWVTIGGVLIGYESHLLPC